MDLLNQFQEYISTHRLFSPKDKLLLAVSGGVDSVVLCELCKQAGYAFAIAHCNFQLRGDDSNRDEEFVKKMAQKYGVAFFSTTFDTNAIAQEQKKSIEETARDLRYTWFYELLDTKTAVNEAEGQLKFILTAHHADDNIETVAMNFFRGTGIKGLRGILPKNNKVLRPLLFARRKEIEDYALLEKLEYVTDATNYENTFTRNFFRNRVLPLVQQFFPGTDITILQNVKRFAEVEQLYNQAIEMHKVKLLEKKGNEIHIPVLKLKKVQPLRSICYEIIKAFNFTASQVDEVIDLLDSESGKYVSSGTHRIIKNRNWLIVAPQITTEADNILIEKGDAKIFFAGGELNIELTKNAKTKASNSMAFLDAKDIVFPLLLRKWKTADYFYPLGMKKKKKLNRFFIDLKLSKTEKEYCWIVESDRRIIWVVGHRIDERFKITDQTRQVLKLTLTPSK